MNTFHHIETHVVDRVGSIVLNRPVKRNAMNDRVISELKLAFEEMQKDDQVKVIILKAKGKVFSAGADLEYLRQLQKNTYEENLADSNHLKELYLQIYSSKKVVIAQVQGHAIAGGCGLASVCDFIYASDVAKFGYTEVRIGFIPALVMVFLLRRIGEGRAKELLLSGKLIDAGTAYDYGLVNEVTKPDTLESKVDHFARELVENNSLTSMTYTRELINDVTSMPLRQALDLAAKTNAKMRDTEDCKRGIEAFLNKQTINW